MERVLQIGEGNFLRAFALDYIQNANENGCFNGEVVICQPRNNIKVIHALKAQDGRYNVIIRGNLNGKIINKTTKITCVSKCIDSFGEYDKLRSLFCSADLQIVISNTTEAGICFDESETIDNIPNKNIPARLTNLLYDRYQSGLGGIVFLPVELIENNADTLKQYIIKYAALWGLNDDFTAYIEKECSFCNTLVDRIVSGHIKDDPDPCSVACEPYASWIIQADERCRKLFPVDALDGVVFADDLSLYRKRKVRILNGAHTMSVLAAYMCGFDIVRDMVNDSLFSEYIKQGMSEIVQTINLPCADFAKSVIERFNNPFIDHKLFDISLNSVSKFKARCLDTILDYMKRNGNPPKILSFAFSALIAFYMHKGSDRKYEPNDSSGVIDFFDSLDSLDDCIVHSVLSNVDFWKTDLSKNESLVKTVDYYYKNICFRGIAKAVEEVVYEQTF